MLNTLSNRLSQVMKKIRGWGSLNETNIKEGLRDIKLALLEADVNYKVVKEFIDGALEEALGEQVLKSLTPVQQFTKVVYDYLVKALGETAQDLNIRSGGLSVIMLVGLQGSGKTTTGVKLARYLQSNYNKRPLLIAADIYRPAAVKQLELLADKSHFPVFKDTSSNPVNICLAGLKYARNNSFGAVIIDTAGRLEIDEKMMAELIKIKTKIDPHEVILVADAATGQAAVSVAQGFDEQLGITGILLSRMDSDARGGAALSMTHITGKHIKLIGTGEKIEDIEKFYPERIALRILNTNFLENQTHF